LPAKLFKGIHPRQAMKRFFLQIFCDSLLPFPVVLLWTFSKVPPTPTSFSPRDRAPQRPLLRFTAPPPGYWLTLSTSAGFFPLDGTQCQGIVRHSPPGGNVMFSVLILCRLFFPRRCCPSSRLFVQNCFPPFFFFSGNFFVLAERYSREFRLGRFPKLSTFPFCFPDVAFSLFFRWR